MKTIEVYKMLNLSKFVLYYWTCGCWQTSVS